MEPEFYFDTRFKTLLEFPGQIMNINTPAWHDVEYNFRIIYKCISFCGIRISCDFKLGLFDHKKCLCS